MPPVDSNSELEDETTAIDDGAQLDDSDNDDEFSSSFAEFAGEDADDEYTEDDQAGDESAPTLTADPKPEPAPVASEAETALALLKAENERLKHQVSSGNGRTSALQKKLDEIEQDRASRLDPNNISVDQEKIDQLQSDYPEVAEAVQAIVTTQIATANQAVNARIQEAMAPMEEAQRNRVEAAQKEGLYLVHPDYEELNESEDYWNWVDSQPEAVQTMAASEFANDVSYVLTSYKTLNGGSAANDGDQLSRAQQKRSKQLADMQGVVSTGGGTPAVVSQDDFSGSFAHFSNKKDRKRAERNR